MSGVVVIGSFNVDHVWRCEALPAPGATLAGDYTSGPGGKGFNQAMAARRAGAQTVFVCALGDDAGGRLARALADTESIDLRDQASDAPTGTAGIFVGADGRNSIVIGAGANATLGIAHVEAQAGTIADARVLLVQLESPVASIAAALRIAREAGVTSVLNPAPANAPTTAALLAAADVLTPNETEFAALIARHTAMAVPAEAVATAGDDALHMLCRTLHPDGSVIITLGAMGSFVSHPDTARRGDDASHYRVPAEVAHVVDTTGAGDAFNGALCASLAARPDARFAEHVAFASHYAARSTEAEGAALAMPFLPVR
ncbi:MAG: ribokinase [Xanthomonadaceae bacterium]|nr:ribokinase [Xanthomonadaceae bacterium]